MLLREKGDKTMQELPYAPKVFVILVNWNGEEDTLSCLQSLQGVLYQNMHVIISDNGSTVESKQKIKSWIENAKVSEANAESGIKTLTLIENGTNLGFTGANRTAIEYALKCNTDYVLFLNNDTTVTKDFLRLMLEVAEGSTTIGIVGCKTLLADQYPTVRRIWSLGGYEYVFGNPMNIASMKLDHQKYSGRRENDLICGCCMLIKKSVIETIGFQDDLLFFGIDDVEYSFRAANAGFRNYLALDAEVIHAGSQSMVGRTGLQLYYLFRNTYYFRRKYFKFHQNIAFLVVHLTRYFVVGGVGRLILGRGKANIGMLLGIYDFLINRMGPCTHTSLVSRTEK